METVVYGDLLFFVNFCMDFQCLFLCSKCTRQPFCVWRAVLAAALGALYASVALFVSVPGAVAFLLDVAVCVGMCALTMAGGGVRTLALSSGVYFLVSFAVGGVMSGMANLLDRAALPVAGEGERLSFAAFLLLAAAGGLSTFLWGRFCMHRAKGRVATLTIAAFGKSVTVRGMVDTANLLHDPLGGAPVILLPLSVAGELLPPPLLLAARDARPTALADMPHAWSRRVRLIPANGVGGARLLLAMRMDKITLDEKKGARAVDALVAPTELSLPHGEYQALLPAALLRD